MSKSQLLSFLTDKWFKELYCPALTGLETQILNDKQNDKPIQTGK